MIKPQYKYEDLHPKHDAWKLAKWWDAEDSELLTNRDLDDAIESCIDSRHPDPISDMGMITVIGYSQYPFCPVDELFEEGEPIKESCSVVVDPLEWTKKHRSDWLESEDER